MDSKYVIFAYWGPRRETAQECAQRLMRLVSDLATIHPALRSWTWLRRRKQAALQGLALAQVTKLVEASMNLAEDNNEPMPEFGFMLPIFNELRPSPTTIWLSITAGGYLHGDWTTNRAWFETEPLQPGNEDLLTYPVMRAAMLALARCWDVTWVRVAPLTIPKLVEFEYAGRPHPDLGGGWITYVSGRFAGIITPPPSVATQYLADGAVVMTATEERFSLDNPVHMTRARDIEAALAPINALPWPPDAVTPKPPPKIPAARR